MLHPRVRPGSTHAATSGARAHTAVEAPSQPAAVREPPDNRCAQRTEAAVTAVSDGPSPRGVLRGRRCQSCGFLEVVE